MTSVTQDTNGGDSSITDELLYIAQCDSEEERRLLLGEASEKHGRVAVEAKGGYVIWLLETLAKVRNAAACEHLTAEQRGAWGIDHEWIAKTLTLAEEAQLGVTRLRRLLHMPNE